MVTMFSSRCCLFCLVTILCICFYVGGSRTKKCAEMDRQALLQLKDGLINGGKFLSSWKGDDCCKWEGISCDNLTGHVTGLAPEVPILGGKIDSSICELKHLTFLDLSHNYLEGEIPKCVGSLGQLIDLKLASNDLVGDIPYTLGNLSKLQTLDLRFNYDLVANDLKWVSHLSNLRYLGLSYLNLSQTIDWLPSISKIPSLSELHLDGCGLGQANPKSIPHINSSTSLKTLSLSSNELNSSTLSWVLNVSKVLTNLDLSYNSLQHNIPGGFTNMITLLHLQYLNLSNNELEDDILEFVPTLFQLKELRLDSNKLSGKLSDYIRQLCSAQNGLELLDLSNNPFSNASLPDFSCLSSLKTLSLGSTNIVGPLPQSFGHLPNLAYLDLGSNLLSGSLPLFEVSELASLEELDLSNNQLNGKLPSNIWQLSSLSTLHLSSNKLNGVDVISEAHHLSNLSYLDLSWNQLSGSSPLFEISRLASLEMLDLFNNQLNGTLPSNIWQLSSLRKLDLSSNMLNGVDVIGEAHLSTLSYLDIRDNQLSGSFPLLEISRLASLEMLDLSNNQLNGTLPSNIWQLSSLRKLDLSSNMLNGVDVIGEAHVSNLSYLDVRDNQLSGSLPLFEFSKLASLEELNVAHNQLNGTLPSNIWQLSSLMVLNLSSNMLNDVDVIREAHPSNLLHLDLRNNQLSGSLPLLEISKLASLELLDLSNNQLNGTLPYNIGQLSNLEMLDLFANKLNGILNDSHLSNLSRLQILDVGLNSLSFNLSSNRVPPFQLGQLAASSCILGPKFPTWLKHQKKLFSLQISNCGISDSFPKWFWDMASNLTYVNVSHNKISGALPISLLRMERNNWNVWDLSFNSLSGPLPPFPKLYALFLSNNMLSGNVSSFCTTSPLELTYLDLSSNLLLGSLSDCWGKFQSLKVLNLAKNNLSGRIPKSFGALRQLESMNLNNNNFSGEIPSLSFCSSLKFIDFGNNNLQGTLPAWVGHNLRHLIVLRLQANKFHGSIPTSLCNLLLLQVLDLSENNITSKIPQCLNNIIALSNTKFPRRMELYDTEAPNVHDFGEFHLFTDKAKLRWKGENRDYAKILGLMTAIDLSCNQLTGEIPKSLTTLVALAGLNLSRNNLTGFIPNNIGHMQLLESLDLSENHLYGRIPASFSNLTFLSYMNLSFNNLSGKIPVTTQLETFDASTYFGNSGLCGPPLTNPCPGDVVSPIGPTDKKSTIEDEDEDEFITFGFYITLGFGFCVGFWGVCGTLLIKTSWRRAYFGFFHNMNDWIYVTLRNSKHKTTRLQTKTHKQELDAVDK